MGTITAMENIMELHQFALALFMGVACVVCVGGMLVSWVIEDARERKRIDNAWSEYRIHRSQKK